MGWIFFFGTLVTVFPGELCGCRTRRIPGGGSLFPGLEQGKRRDPQASVHETLPARALLLQYGLWRAVKRSFSARESVWGTVLLPGVEELPDGYGDPMGEYIAVHTFLARSIHAAELHRDAERGRKSDQE